MKKLDNIDFWTERNVPLQVIINRLSERSDDECYTVFRWVEDKAAKEGFGIAVPDLAKRPDFVHNVPLLMACMQFPPKTPELLKEAVAMCFEHTKRAHERKLAAKNRN